jgi:hypothetical protein
VNDDRGTSLTIIRLNANLSVYSGALRASQVRAQFACASTIPGGQ